MINTVKIEYNVPGKMRDGTTLMANVFQPGEPGKYPVLLTRTPYGKDFMTGFPYMDMVRLAKSGFIVVVQDVRGRGASEGTFELFINESEDGYDSVEWAAGLDNSNGNVGMWGFSYLSFTQWAAALLNPPSLKAIAPTFTPTDFTNGVYWRGGALELGLCIHLAINSLGMENVYKKYGTDAEKLGAAITAYVKEVDRIPFGGVNSFDLSKIDTFINTGIGLEDMQYILDNYLDARFTRFPYTIKERLAEVSIPSLNIAGWNDIFLQDTIDSFNTQKEQGNQTQLLIGPWAHLNYSGTVGEVDYGMAGSMSFINMQYDHVSLLQKWFDHWLKDDHNGIDKEKSVNYFIGGESAWYSDTQWPPKGMKETPYYLHEEGILNSFMPTNKNISKTFMYDPNDPVPTHGGAILMHPYFISGSRDQQIINKRSDLLIFATDELDQDLRLAGPVKMNLWISTSAVDTDFVATLLDIHPDGKVFNMTDGIVRAKYRDGNEPQLLSPGKIYQLSIDLWSVGHTFLKGHRLALRITSSNFPRWDRNLNNGGSSFDPVIARQTIYMDSDHPSHVILPVLLG